MATRRHSWPGALLAAVLLQAVAASGTAESPTDGVPLALPGAPPLPDALRARLVRALAERGPDYVPRTRHLGPDGAPRYTNRLLLEASPYLQQHAHNPVNWFPWGDEAFDVAQRLDRPVLVSIGYSTCHWCHVMEEESFDDPEIARILNQGFVAIKVDREVRPDIDSVYMTVAHALNGSGGWPLNVWVTPSREPFYAGTYFPPKDRGGRPGLPTVLAGLSETYRSEPDRVQGVSRRLTERVRRQLAGQSATQTRLPGPAVLKHAAARYRERVDRTWGGIGRRQKFPSQVPIRFLLRYHRRTGDTESLALAVLTLENMAAGGMNDHLGGGFHRYSTDPRWLVPHFEKMLYDNALLALAYLEAWQATSREDFARVTRETLEAVLRELGLPEGGFASATDADSPGEDGEPEEGLFFTWTPSEIRTALPPDEAAAVIAWYGVTPSGHLDGRSVLHTWRTMAEVSAELGRPADEVREILEGTRPRLLRVRAARPPPLRDDKLLVAWNGLAISALARAGFALEEPRWTEAARSAADRILSKRTQAGHLPRVIQAERAQGPAFLEDYAFLVAGLLDLYEADPDPRWLREALALQRVLDSSYADAEGGGYYRTAVDQERLLAREKPDVDSALPSGNSVAALNLLRLHDLGGDPSHLARAGLLLSSFSSSLELDPTRHSELLSAVDASLDATKEIVVVTPRSGSEPEAMLRPLRRLHVPNRTLSIVREGPDLAAHAALVPVVSGKVARGGQVTAYVCENRVCELPTTDPEVFAGQLTERRPLNP
ncbi:MAG: thioredoxin domain-containing protein [Myxococcota bacterium]